MRTILGPIVLLLLAWPALAQQQARQMSLEDAIQYALTESIKIKNAQISIADADQQIIERRSAGIPQLSGSVQYTHYLKVPRQPLPEGFGIFNVFGQALAVDLFPLLSENTQAALTEALQGSNGGNEEGIAFFLKNNFTAGLNLDAMVFDASWFVALQASREFRNYTQIEFATQKREVENAVTEAYLPVLLIQENIELLDKNISNLEKLFFETKELYRAGFSEQLDIDRLELSLSNLQVERENLVRQKQLAMENLKFHMGYPLEEPLAIADDLNQMLTDAGASDDQKSKLKAIVTTTIDEVRPDREARKAMRDEIIKLIEAPTIDRNAIEALRAKQMAQFEERSKAIAKAVADAAEILTPDQRRKLVEEMRDFGPHGRW